MISLRPLASIGISFPAALWWGWVLLAAAASTGVLIWLYRRMFVLYPRKQAITLVALKSGAVSLLLISLLHPTLYREEKDLANARVILLVDDSGSMGTRDGTLGEPRINDARRAAFEKILPRLNGKLLVTPLAFADSIRSLEKPEQLTAKGTSTDIPNALLDSSKYVKSGGIGAFVLITDGGDGRALPPAFTVGAPVFSLAVGSDLSKSDDLSIGEISYPERVDSKTDFDVKVEVAASGHSDFLNTLQSVALTLSEGPKEIVAQPVKLSASERKQTVTLRVSAAEPGIHRYSLKLPVMKTEVATLNNERTFTVEVQDALRRVLFYSSKLGQGYKPLRNALKSDPGIHITGLVRVGADRFLLQGERPDDNFKNEFPSTLDVLKKFKCIVVADSEAKDLSPAAQKGLEEFVSDGGALVLLGGPGAFGSGAWDQTPLAPAFPWQIAGSEPPFRNESVNIELTAQGRVHPIFKDLGPAFSSEAGASPRMTGYNTPGALRPGAQALVEAALSSGEHPAVVALSRYGKGKVLGIASHALWLWSDAEAEGGKTYSAFWRQTIRFMIGSEDNGGLLNLIADRQGRYAAGATATVTAHVLDRSLTPLKGASLSATLKKLDGTVVGAVPFHEDGPPGSYSSQVELSSAGAYRLQVSASDSKGVLETREILLEAGTGPGEGAFLAVNTSYLQELADKTGGLVLSQDKADELADKILDGVKAEVRRKETSLLWDNPIYFLLFVGLMTCEWVARRKMNLI